MVKFKEYKTTLVNWLTAHWYK